MTYGAQHEGEQPCRDFKTVETLDGGMVFSAPFGMSLDGYSPLAHECPICLKMRWFCATCHADHHEGGWETCKPATKE